MEMEIAMLHTITIESPLGPLRLVARDDELAGVYLPEQNVQTVPAAEQRSTVPPAQAKVLEIAALQLAEYFAGARTVFDLPIGPRGSGFQERVWRALLAIPYGTTITYGELAREIGRPAASRAVGSANSRNPISIIVPCHRVIAASGELTGYAGGLAAKRWLIDHERVAREAIVGSEKAVSTSRTLVA
jgi:methylated-DNA-[protein]-cysteine S-methyltransferase